MSSSSMTRPRRPPRPPSRRARRVALRRSLGLGALLSLTVLGEAAAGKPTGRAAALERVAQDELELTTAANAVAKGRLALARERESLEWAGGLIARRSAESLRVLEVYRGVRVEREEMATVRARELYKLARGGGMLELMFEEGVGGRMTPRERTARGKTVRQLIDHDLELLHTHAEAEQRARDELLTATRELRVLAALDSIGWMQSAALELADTQIDPALATTHKRRVSLERTRSGRRTSDELRVLEALRSERRTLRRHKGLDLLEKNALARPVPGRVAGRFGTYKDRMLDIDMHRNGVELAARANDRVRALAPGEVVLVGALPGFERVVVIDHGGGYLSLTGRLLTVKVEEGQEVGAGDTLGRVGAKAVRDGLGTTAYVEVRHGHRPIDPAPFLRKSKRDD